MFLYGGHYLLKLIYFFIIQYFCLSQKMRDCWYVEFQTNSYITEDNFILSGVRFKY